MTAELGLPLSDHFIFSVGPRCSELPLLRAAAAVAAVPESGLRVDPPLNVRDQLVKGNPVITGHLGR